MRILEKIGMCASYKGYCYWEEAISIVKKSRKDKINMTNIYIKIAEKYGEKYTAVERNMARALEKVKNIEQKLNVDYELTTKKALILLANKEKGE